MVADFGARIETGKLKEKKGEKWRVESYSRRGIVTPPLTVLQLEDTKTSAYAAGDKVFFCLGSDGNGLVLCKIDE